MPRLHDDTSPFEITISGILDPATDGTTVTTPATIAPIEGMLVVSHPLFRVEIDPARQRASLHRTGGNGLALGQAIRAALLSALPLRQGIAIHACAAATPAGAIVFHGRSGAGKSTLAMTSPWPLLSDELVVLRRYDDSWVALPSGFWGGARGHERVDGANALRALVTLRKGPRFHATCESLSDTRRSVVASLHIPPAKQLWDLTLPLAENLVNAVPGITMAWAKDEPPWRALDEFLRATSREA